MYSCIVFFFFFNDTATTEIYTLSLHDALPICDGGARRRRDRVVRLQEVVVRPAHQPPHPHRSQVVTRRRSEEHTSELQSRPHLVCRLLLEKKKTFDLSTPGQTNVVKQASSSHS